MAGKRSDQEERFSLKSLTTEELDALISVAMSHDESETDYEYLDALTEEYATRECEDMPEVDVEQAWEDFQHRIARKTPESNSTTKKISFPHIRRWLTVAAVFALVISTLFVIQTEGSRTAQWNDRMFSLGSISTDTVRASTKENTVDWPEVTVPDDAVFDSLQDALDAYGVTEVAELDMPEGFEFYGLDICESEPWYLFYTSYYYNGGEHKITVEYSPYEGIPKDCYGKDSTPVQRYVSNGIEYYEFQRVQSVNETWCTVAWVTEHFECYISTDLSEEILLDILGIGD